MIRKFDMLFPLILLLVLFLVVGICKLVGAG